MFFSNIRYSCSAVLRMKEVWLFIETPFVCVMYVVCC